MWRRGRRPTAAIVRDSIGYACDVLGSQRFAPWLIAQSTFRGALCEGWITDTYMGEVVARQLNQPFGPAATRTLASRLLPTAPLPDLGYLIDGCWYDRTYRRCSTEEFAALLFTDHESVVMKFDGSGSGRGVSFVTRADFAGLCGTPGRQRAVFQYPVTQHTSFDGFAVAGTTIRVTTVREPDGSVSARDLFVRFPLKGKHFVGQGSSCQVFLNLQTGLPCGPAVTDQWDLLTAHPDYGTAFAVCCLPDHHATLQTVIAQHTALPHYACIGWDVMVDTHGRAVILEWNTDYPSVSTAEAAIGPHFRGLNWEQLNRRPGGQHRDSGRSSEATAMHMR